jgi:hypothetical protein
MRRMRHLPTPTPGLPAVLLALLLAVLCGGCGSSRTSTTSARAGAAGGAATKAQFIARAESICATLSSQEKPLKTRQESLKGLPVATADREFVSLVHQLVDFSQTAVSKLQALARPAHDALPIEKLLTSLSAETKEANAIAAAASRQESSLGEADQDALRRSIANNRALAAEYGMKDCIGGE